MLARSRCWCRDYVVLCKINAKCIRILFEQIVKNPFAFVLKLFEFSIIKWFFASKVLTTAALFVSRIWKHYQSNTGNALWMKLIETDHSISVLEHSIHGKAFSSSKDVLLFAESLTTYQALCCPSRTMFWRVQNVTVAQTMLRSTCKFSWVFAHRNYVAIRAEIISLLYSKYL